MLWLALSIVVSGLIVYLLYLPIDLVINTDHNRYYIKVGFLARADVQGDSNYIVRIRLRTPVYRTSFYPLKKRKQKVKKEKKTKAVDFRKAFKIKYIKLGYRLLKSFEIKRFALHLDTGSCITNAKLFPLCAFLNYRGGNFNINFTNRNHLDLHIQNRPIRIIQSFINPKKLYHGITL